jgi:hypothetical protein
VGADDPGSGADFHLHLSSAFRRAYSGPERRFLRYAWECADGGPSRAAGGSRVPPRANSLLRTI